MPAPHPTVAVVGLGYVGLPVGLRFAEAGYRVIAVDSDPGKIEQLRERESYVEAASTNRLAAVVDSGKFDPTTEISSIADADAIVICLPTPLSENREPDLSYVLNAGNEIGKHLKEGSLVVLESTSYPGTTDTDLRGVLEQASGMKAGCDFHLAYSPEREDPGRTLHSLQTIPKLVGGFTEACTERAVALYQGAVDTLYPVDSCRIAEAAKLLENVFRSVNIALVNELKTVFHHMDIDVWKVIDAAATKPFGFMRFDPGPGLGGHCIPIDPFYLTWAARQFNQSTRFIELAGEINTRMPEFVVRRAIEALNAEGKPVKGSRILLLGLAYKPNVDDDRESPAYALMDRFEKMGAEVAFNDPHIPKIRKTRRWPHFSGRKSVPISDDYDLILLVTHHDDYRDHDFSNYPCPLVDTRRCITRPPEKYYLA